MGRESEPMAFCALVLGPAGFVGDHFDNLSQAACFPGIRFVIRTIVWILHIGEVQSARWSYKVEQIFHGVAICPMGQFIGETLDSECVVYVGHRSQPAYPDMSLRRAVLDAYVWQIVRKIRPTLCQVGRVAINGVHIKDRSDGRKDRSLQPRGGLSFIVDGG